MLPAIFSFFLCPCCPSREKAKHSSWLLVRLPLLVLELDSWIGSAFVGFLGYRIGCCRVARRRWLNLILAEFFLVLRPISSHLTILLFVIRFRERLRLRALHLPTVSSPYLFFRKWTSFRPVPLLLIKLISLSNY
jgi:hypothetical protein